jgi:catechol 2,3-dioxygenase-like lactoylglutathione lyase family enzyme
MAVRRAFPNILSDRLPETRDFYVGLLGFEVGYDSDWFVALVGDGGHELGIWQVGHELVPPSYRAEPAGLILTFVVDDVDEIHGVARRAGLPVVAPPRDLFYGQRQMLLTDPNGLLVDVSTPSTPSPAFRDDLARRGLAPEPR